MAAPDPGQLLELAAREINPIGQLGAPRQVDLRRGISTAYYAVFHALCRELADEFCRGNVTVWRRLYRAVDHGTARKHCEQYKSGDPGLQSFANALVQLQQDRHKADYDPDPVPRLTKQTAERAISMAKDGISGLATAEIQQRRVFLIGLIARRS